MHGVAHGAAAVSGGGRRSALAGVGLPVYSPGASTSNVCVMRSAHCPLSPAPLICPPPLLLLLLVCSASASADQHGAPTRSPNTAACRGRLEVAQHGVITRLPSTGRRPGGVPEKTPTGPVGRPVWRPVARPVDRPAQRRRRRRLARVSFASVPRAPPPSQRSSCARSDAHAARLANCKY